MASGGVRGLNTWQEGEKECRLDLEKQLQQNKTQNIYTPTYTNLSLIALFNRTFTYYPKLKCWFKSINSLFEHPSNSNLALQ